MLLWKKLLDLLNFDSRLRLARPGNADRFRGPAGRPTPGRVIWLEGVQTRRFDTRMTQCTSPHPPIDPAVKYAPDSSQWVGRVEQQERETSVLSQKKKKRGRAPRQVKVVTHSWLLSDTTVTWAPLPYLALAPGFTPVSSEPPEPWVAPLFSQDSHPSVRVAGIGIFFLTAFPPTSDTSWPPLLQLKQNNNKSSIVGNYQSM